MIETLQITGLDIKLAAPRKGSFYVLDERRNRLRNYNLLSTRIDKCVRHSSGRDDKWLVEYANRVQPPLFLTIFAFHVRKSFCYLLKSLNNDFRYGQSCSKVLAVAVSAWFDFFVTRFVILLPSGETASKPPLLLVVRFNLLGSKEFSHAMKETLEMYISTFKRSGARENTSSLFHYRSGPSISLCHGFSFYSIFKLS